MKVENRKVEKIGVIAVMNDCDVIQLEFELDNQLTPLLKLSDCNNVYINYQNGLTKDRFRIPTVIVENGTAKFFWTLGKNATKKAGKTYFVICAQRTNNGVILQEWNTILTSFDVEKGLEVLTENTEEYADIFSQLFDEIETKQNKLRAGDGIEIDGDVISATGASGDWATKEELQEEANARIHADTDLQNQIDAITVSSDVIDVLGTYQDLLNYDTSHVKDNNIIKVMQDSTHNNAISYYRWVIAEHVGSWVYVGSEGPYYTKGETDNLLTLYLPIFQGISQVGKVLAVNGNGNAIPTALQTLTGRKQLDLLNAPSTSPMEIATIINAYGTGVFDIINGGFISANGFQQGDDCLREVEQGDIVFIGSNETAILAGQEFFANLSNNDRTANWGNRRTLSVESAEQALANYQPKNRYITNTAVALADWEEEATPTYADYPYVANITIQGVTANNFVDVIFDVESATSGKIAPIVESVEGGIKIYASEAVAITIPTIKIEV